MPSPQNKSALPPFSAQDAQALVQLARRAPLPNMEVAEQAAAVIERFANWYSAQMPPVKAPGSTEKAK